MNTCNNDSYFAFKSSGASIGSGSESALEESSGVEESREDERENSGELDENVKGRAGGILERITDGVTNNGSLVFFRSLLDDGAIRSDEALTFNVLLSVVPSTTGVSGGDSHGDTRHQDTREDTSNGGGSEEQTDGEGSTNNDGSREEHFRDGRAGSNTDARFVVGSSGTSEDTWVLSDLLSDFFNHFLSGLGDGLHGKSGECVGEHSTDQETRENKRVGDVNT